MSDPSDAESSRPQRGAKQPAPYLRLPWYVVAAALILVLGAALAIGLNATRSTRSEPAAAPPPATPTPPIPTAAIATATAPAPAAATTPESAAAATIPPPAPATVTPAPTPLILSLASTSTPILSSATDVPTPLPTVEPTLAADVGAAYENFWRIRSQALLELDETHLAEAMDGDYLTLVLQRISDLRAEGRAIKTHVVLNYFVIEASHQAASVVDDFEDDSVYVKIGTEDPLTEPTFDQLRVLYKLTNFSGVWKVVDSVRPEE